jgi:hypothetical protein
VSWSLPADASTSASLPALADFVLTGTDQDHLDLLCAAVDRDPAWSRLINAILPGTSPAVQEATGGRSSATVSASIAAPAADSVDAR